MKKIWIALVVFTMLGATQKEEKIFVDIPYCGFDWDESILENESVFKVYGDEGVLPQVFDFKKKVIPARKKDLRFVIKGLPEKSDFSTYGKWINRQIYPGETLYFKVPNLEDEENALSYRLYVKGKVEEEEEEKFPFFKSIKDYELRVFSEGKNESLIKMDVQAFSSGGFEGGIFIYWMGDLNGDHELDILVGKSKHYAGVNLILFLSNKDSEQLFETHQVGHCSLC